MNLTSTPHKLIPFDLTHLDVIEARDEQKEEFACMQALNLEDVDVLNMRAFTGICGTEIIGCAGIFEQWRGRWITWAVYSRIMVSNPRHGLMAFKWTRKFLDEAIQQDDVNRLECTVRQDFTKAHAFAIKLGFQREGIMSKYDPNGHDHTLYSRTF